MSKTVYILGAGFSVLANLPQQSDLLRRIFERESNDLFSLDDPSLLGTELRYKEAKRDIADFILQFFSCKNIFSFLPSSSVESMQDFELNELKKSLKETPQFYDKIYEFICTDKSFISLEDIFTILDKAYVSNEHIQGYDLQRIIDLRESFLLCIIRLFAIAEKENQYNNETYINFITNLMNLRKESGEDGDPVSIITLNWDAVFDVYFNHLVENNKDYKGFRLDYCIYDHNYDYYFPDTKESPSPDINIPSTLLKRLGYYNFKFLKLHGAMNWLVCKNCQRLFYSRYKYISLLEFLDSEAPTCPYCKGSYTSNGYNNQIKLKAELITPTLLKNLNNVIFKNLWKNAFVELSEASRVVFIGYSLPQADFELRYLLKKAIKPNTKIEVVLYHNDDPGRLKSYISEESILHQNIIDFLPEKRYRSFFGVEDIEFFYEGLQGYVSKM